MLLKIMILKKMKVNGVTKFKEKWKDFELIFFKILLPALKIFNQILIICTSLCCVFYIEKMHIVKINYSKSIHWEISFLLTLDPLIFKSPIKNKYAVSWKTVKCRTVHIIGHYLCFPNVWMWVYVQLINS